MSGFKVRFNDGEWNEWIAFISMDRFLKLIQDNNQQQEDESECLVVIQQQMSSSQSSASQQQQHQTTQQLSAQSTKRNSFLFRLKPIIPTTTDQRNKFVPSFENEQDALQNIVILNSSQVRLFQSSNVSLIPISRSTKNYLSLQHIILVAYDQQSRQIADQNPNFKELFLSKQPIHKDTYIETFEFGQNARFKVRDCFPLEQGLVTSKTLVFCIGPFNQLPSNRSLLNQSNELTPDKKSSLVLRRSLLQPIYDDKVDLPVFQLDSIKSCTNLKSRRILETSIDSEYIAFVSVNGLKRLRCFEKQWALLKPINSSLTRMVFVMVSDDIISDNVMLLQPTLFHNFETTQCEVLLHNGSMHMHIPTIPNSIKIAKFVELIRIKSVESSHNQKTHDLAISQYFTSQKRFLALNDIISVNSVKDLSFVSEFEKELILSSQSEQPSSNLSSNVILYFKVSKLDTSTGEEQEEAGSEVEVNQHLIVPDFTTLSIAKGSIHSKIPQIKQSIDVEKELFENVMSYIRPSLYSISNDLKYTTSLLLKGPQGNGKSQLFRNVAAASGLHLVEFNCFELLGQSESQTEKSLREAFTLAREVSPSLLLLRKIQALEKAVHRDQFREKRSVIGTVLKSLISDLSSNQHQVIVGGTIENIDDISGNLRAVFRYEILVDSPNESQRLSAFRSLLKDVPLSYDVSLKELSMLSASLSTRDAQQTVIYAGMEAISRLSHFSNNINASILSELGLSLWFGDFESAINKLKSESAQSTIKIPKISWSDVGGLADAKNEILDTIQLPIQHPDLFAEGIRKRSGVLLFGPPGTGKTLLAKAVATECALNFISVKGPELLNMYIGESEKNVRDLFERARQASPAVIFFDELDSLAPNRGQGADSGGVMDRIVSQLLSELDGIQKSNSVFVIGATNRPDLIDPALLRPGRFDRLVYLGVAESHQAQFDIMKALTRKFNLGNSVDLMKVAEQCPFNFTGADFYALCSDSLLAAVSETIQSLETKKQTTVMSEVSDEQASLVVEQHHFISALQKLTPSVSMKEMLHYKALKATLDQQRANEQNEKSSTTTTTVGSSKMEDLSQQHQKVIEKEKPTTTTTTTTNQNELPQKKRKKNRNSNENEN